MKQKVKWVESLTWPGWGYLEPFHDNENELIPSYIGEAIEEHVKALHEKLKEKDEEIQELNKELEIMYDEKDRLQGKNQ